MQALSFEIASILKDDFYKVESEFVDSAGNLIHISFSCKGQSFRLHYKDVHRLFFYDPLPFNFTLIKNEYGVESGKLIYFHLPGGKVFIHSNSFHYKLTGDDPKMVLFYPKHKKAIVEFDINDELLIRNMDDKCQKEFLHSLVFSFGWIYCHEFAALKNHYGKI